MIVLALFAWIRLAGRDAKYEIGQRYKVAAVSLAKRCEMRDLTVEHRVLDDFTGPGRDRVCVERKSASLAVVPDYAKIDSLPLRQGFGIVLVFSGEAKDKISRTMEEAAHETVVVYRDNQVFKFVRIQSGDFVGLVNFWYDNLEEAEKDMDRLRAPWIEPHGVLVHGDEDVGSDASE